MARLLAIITESAPHRFVRTPYEIRETGAIVCAMDDTKAPHAMKKYHVMGKTSLQDVITTVASITGDWANADVAMPVTTVHARALVCRMLHWKGMQMSARHKGAQLRFNDLVEETNIPAILAYEERLSFSPGRLFEMLGGTADYPEAVAVEDIMTLCASAVERLANV